MKQENYFKVVLIQHEANWYARRLTRRWLTMHLVDFAILTGLLEEFEVVRDLLPTMEELHEGHSPTWYRTSIQGRGENRYEIVVAYQDGMGPLQASSLTHAVISRWNPAQILLVGIAGSLDKDVTLGDVVVSQQVFYYSPGKASDQGMKFRPEGYPASVSLLRQLEALRADGEDYRRWQSAAVESAARIAGKESHNRAPHIHFGTLASGHLVVAAEEMKSQLLSLHGKLLATEMEGAGVLHAAYYNEPPVRAIVVKGISDAADPAKAEVDASSHWRSIAKNNSALAALHLIVRGRIPALGLDRFELNEPVAGSLAEACSMIETGSVPGVSCLGFPRLVVPRGVLTSAQIQVNVRGAEGPLDVARCLVRYLDRELESRQKESRESTEIVIDGPIAASAIGLFILVRGTPTEISFNVRTPLQGDHVTWRPGPASRVH